MRDTLTDEERNYIIDNIFKPLEPAIDKIPLFENTNRAKTMLLNTLKLLKFKDQDKYDANLDFVLDPNNNFCHLVLVGKHKECSEVLTHKIKINL